MDNLVLEIVEGPGAGRQFRLTEPIEIGRDHSLPLVLEDPLVSRRHARLIPAGRDAIVEDLGSANGTFVNGQEIHTPTSVKPGDQVLLGVTVLEVRSPAQIAERPSAVRAIPPALARAPQRPDYVPEQLAVPAGQRAGGRASTPELEALLDRYTKRKARLAPLAVLALVAIVVSLFVSLVVRRSVPNSGSNGAGGLFATGSARADGAVYAMSNSLGHNEVVVYHRASDGTLTFRQRIATGGGGSGVQLDPTDSLGSQGGLVVDTRNSRVFAVNTETLKPDGSRSDPGFPNTEAGDCQTGSISSFTILPDGQLKFDDRVPSGGLFPASLTVNGGLLYVLNSGGPGVYPLCGIGPNITGFNVDSNGHMSPLAGSVQPIVPGTSPGSFLNCDPGGGPFPTAEFQCGLNPPAFPRSPAQVGFSPDGEKLVVTVKGTNKLYVFSVGSDGSLETPTVTQIGTTTQPTPFGFAFTKTGGLATRQLVVTEPFGTSGTIPNPTAGAASSYQIGSDGSVRAISSHVANEQGTSCWIAIAPGGTYAYVSNNLSSNISAYKIGADGSLILLQSIAGSAKSPNDLAAVAAGNSRFLYALASGDGVVTGFRINGDGSLTPIGSVGGLPVADGAAGLAGY